MPARTATTFGAPGLSSFYIGSRVRSGLPRVQCFRTEEGEDGWLRAFVGHEAVSELLRTPTYSTWQGSMWRLCCQRRMRALAGMLGDENDEDIWDDVSSGPRSIATDEG